MGVRRAARMTWACVVLGCALPAGAQAKKPKKIACTVKAVEKAVAKSGAYELQCFGKPSIQVPKPKKKAKGGLGPGFTVKAGKHVSFTAPPGDEASFENESERGSRIFTVEKGGSLSLTRIHLSASAQGPKGSSAGKAKTGGDKGENGESGVEEVELAQPGNSGAGGREGAAETSEAGGDGTNGVSGGFVAGLALQAPPARGGAISNAGTLELSEDEFQGDTLEGGGGGNGGSGGHGGAGGNGGQGGNGAPGLRCTAPDESSVEYSSPPGAGGEGGKGAGGGPGTGAGGGGAAEGGAIYNSGKLKVGKTVFGFDSAHGGIGGNGGAGGAGGDGGNGGNGNPGGSGGGAGNGNAGGNAGAGASGLGGAIYNTGKLEIEGSTFREDAAEGGSSGDGGDGGDAGKGGGGALAFPFNECVGAALQTKVPAAGEGGEGGSGAPGGDGAGGGAGEGGAIYSTASFTLVGSSFSKDSVKAGLGATCSTTTGARCPGKGSEPGEGGEGGPGTPSGAHGNKGPTGGSDGKAGADGAGLGKDVFGGPCKDGSGAKGSKGKAKSDCPGASAKKRK